MLPFSHNALHMGLILARGWFGLLCAQFGAFVCMIGEPRTVFFCTAVLFLSFLFASDRETFITLSVEVYGL